MKFLIILVLLPGMVMSNCDVNKCMAFFTNLDMSDLNKLCGDMREAVTCLEDVVNTCSHIQNSEQVNSALNNARSQVSAACSNVQPGQSAGSVPARCDAMGCLRHMQGLDYSDPSQSCPPLNSAINCLQGVVNTCELLNGDAKISVQQSIDSSRQNYNKHCSRYANGGDLKKPFSTLFISAAAIFVYLFRWLF